MPKEREKSQEKVKLSMERWDEFRIVSERILHRNTVCPVFMDKSRQQP
jgi:hypothetical protein